MATRVCVLRLRQRFVCQESPPRRVHRIKGSTSARAQPSGPVARSIGIIRASLWSRATNLPPISPSLVAVPRPAHDVSVLRFMPASGPHPRSSLGASNPLSERAIHPTRIVATRVQGDAAMDVLDCVKPESESISIARCRELLGEEAETMLDEEVLAIAHHAESLARVVIELAVQHDRVH